MFYIEQADNDAIPLRRSVALTTYLECDKFMCGAGQL
jgi:hypothetical protein